METYDGTAANETPQLCRPPTGAVTSTEPRDRRKTRSSPHPSALVRPCLRPSQRVPARPVPSKPPPAARRRTGGGFDGTERAGTRSDGLKQGRDSADGCCEDRASHTTPLPVLS